MRCFDAGVRLGARIFAFMTVASQLLGEEGERIAEAWLVQRGWRILDRRFRSGHRDLDLVAEREGIVAFVEVKARRGRSFGHPVEAVNWRKQRELTRSAWVWIARYGGAKQEFRFDVVGVLMDESGTRVRHVENAFSARGVG
ncbi:MAG TPA: YraN family protein [Gemmatimonadaceae bacterium]|nr:YraN family protein [Gemmatimonadaceae bacterium]